VRVLTLDSGIGGLSIVDAFARANLAVSILHLADDAWRPYGDKPPAELAERVAGLAAEAAKAFEASAIVLACNTASTIALDAVRTRLPDVPVIGVVPPIKPAAAMTKTGVIGLLATPATIARPYVDELIREHAPNTRVIRKGSLGLVAIAEGSLRGKAASTAEIAREVSDMFDGEGRDIDVVCLACTHFPLLRVELERVGPQGVHWIDSGDAVARRLRTVLNAKEGAFHFAAAMTTGPLADLSALRPSFDWWRNPVLDRLPGWDGSS
jgi:glutamate racemase